MSLPNFRPGVDTDLMEVLRMGKQDSNGDEIPQAKPSVLERILLRARVREAAGEQAAAKRVRDARERSRQARVRAQQARKDKEGK